MLKGELIHPEILRALAAAGHGSTVLIADGNYPVATKTHPAAARVHLNLRPGVLRVTEVLQTLVSAIPVESATVMVPEGGKPEGGIFSEFRQILDGMELEGVGRFEFYRLASEPDLALAIATGDQRLYANILFTVGVRK